MTFSLRSLLPLLPVFLASTAASAKVAVDLSKGKNTVEFHAVGKPSFLKINGEDEDKKGLSGTITKDGDKYTGEAVFKMAVMTTGLDLRDKHMKEKYLQVDKFPEAKLAITKLPWGKDDTSDFDGKKGPFEGTFTLHGVTKPVTGEAEVTRDGKTIEAEVKFTIKVTDFGIDIPSFQGVTVADTVDVDVNIKSPVVGG